jgi:predicted nucleic acid-binding Zn ribbon protein
VSREPTRLGDVLEAAMARLPLADELVNYPIWSEWTTLVGAVVAGHTRPKRLRRGVLVVDVDGPEWMHQLRYLKRDLCQRLNDRLGKRVVRDLFLVLAHED